MAEVLRTGQRSTDSAPGGDSPTRWVVDRAWTTMAARLRVPVTTRSAMSTSVSALIKTQLLAEVRTCSWCPRCHRAACVNRLMSIA
jgi:hypothetical protein